MDYGRSVVQDHDLERLRRIFGFSRTAQAHMIGVNPTTLKEWELGNPLSRTSAKRIGEWFMQVNKFMEETDRDVLTGVAGGGWVHITVASQRLAMSYGTIIRKCQQGLLGCLDLGPLGLYVDVNNVS